ncbi:MAG: asparagine--tRNA ligase [Bacteroidales bacterium]|nr:asparagine--tRNA ligase [Bacteroidales bacterium]
MPFMNNTRIADILKTEDFSSIVTVGGWVRTKRESKNVTFITLNDGSTIKNIQIVIEGGKLDDTLLSKIQSGAALVVEGELIESPGQGQKIELKAHKVEIAGEADPDFYPLQPKKHSLEFLREIAHLRFRTNTFGAITRLRHAMIYAIHKYFNDRGFFNIHTPIITGSDAEGAGETFRVTTLPVTNPPMNENKEVDFSQDFFGRETNLTVSGQLEAELAALGMSLVYTFGPTFRAENSNTSRHLAEFWMIEPEMAFYDNNDNMDLAEDMVKYLLRYVLDNCPDDLQFLSNRLKDEEKSKKQEDRSPMELIEKLRFVIDNSFERITYSEAYNILRNSKPNKKKKFQFPVDKWGIDFQSEHERYLVEKHFKKPVSDYDYPSEIKAFYMKQNENKQTVRAIDVLIPQIREIIGGPPREVNYDRFITSM